MSTVPEDVLVATRSALHGIVENVLAGPQHRASGRFDLRVVPGAVETVAAPHVRLTPEAVSGPGGEASLLGSTTARAVAAAIDVVAGEPQGVYRDHSLIGPDDSIEIDLDAATALFDWFAVGAAALLQLAPAARAALWPERFELVATLDGVDCGVSAGDADQPQPYAFVRPSGDDGPATATTPTAVRAWDAVPDAASLAAFLAAGREGTASSHA